MDFKINPCLKNYKLDKNNVCDLCQKRILREEELSNIELNCDSEEICVITTSDRVNTKYILHPFRVFSISALIVFGSSLFTLNVKAQDTINQIQDSIAIEREIIVEQDVFTISGTVMDENNEPVPFVNIYIPDDEGGYITGATADFDGNFALKIDPNKINTDTFLVKISSVEFRTQEILFTKKEIMENIKLGKYELKIDQVVMKEHIELLGFYIIEEPRLDKDPDAHRSTKIGGDELRRSPYRH